MKRRTFLLGTGVGTGAALAAPSGPEIAITMDDVAWASIPEPFAPRARRAMLDTLERNRVKAALFAAGRNVDNETGRAILNDWSDAGHAIGNHTFSHRAYSSMTFDEFSADVLRCEPIVKPLHAFNGMFRFPALKEGETAAKRDRMRDFLRVHGYRNGSVTIDASDWYYDSRLRDRLEAEPSFDVSRFRQPYLDHLLERARYYDGLARQVLGRSPKHTLLVHYNLINALFLGDAMENFRSGGWRWLSAEEAFRDPVFRTEPKTVPAGESLIWAIAKQTGRFEDTLRYPGEDGQYEKAVADRI